jgi:hypothetical protein
MYIFVSARLQATAAPDAPAPMISTSTGSFMPVFPHPAQARSRAAGNDRNCWIQRNLLDAASKRYASKRFVVNEKGRRSALLVCPVTRSNVNLVHSVAITVGFAQDRAMLAFELDSGDGEPEFFGVTGE